MRFRIEEHPTISAIIFWIVSIPLSALISFFIASDWRKNHFSEQVALANQALVQQTERVADMISYKFDVMRRFTAILAFNPRVASTLAGKENTVEINHYLQQVCGVLGLHRAFILNKNGVCIASNDGFEVNNLLGTNLADRDYFKRAMAGEGYSQFVVGRVSAVPGFHFSSPVQIDDATSGVVVLKADTVTLAQQLYLPTGFVTDSMGVVVIADDPADMLRVMPGEAAASFNADECRLRYQSDKLDVVYLREAFVNGIQAWILREGGNPHLCQVVNNKGDGLNVYGFTDIEPIISETQLLFERYYYTLFIALVLGSGLGIGALISLLRDRYLRNSLQHLNKQLKILAQYDSLTGLLNRRLFDDTFASYFAQARRVGTPFALIIFDIDHFKKLNDALGHQEGDRVLREVAMHARESLTRETDKIFRIGGEEFAVLTLVENEEQLWRVMENIRREVETLGIPHPESRTACVTISLGGALVRNGSASTTGDIFKRADGAMYSAKSQGRNKAVLAQSV